MANRPEWKGGVLNDAAAAGPTTAAAAATEDPLSLSCSLLFGPENGSHCAEIQDATTVSAHPEKRGGGRNEIWGSLAMAGEREGLF